MLSFIRKYNIRAIIFIAILQILYSCDSKTPLPTASITTKINGNVVEFTLECENTELYDWDFGDGGQVSNEQNPVHVFPEFGKEYTVTLKLTGDGGETTITHVVAIRSMTKMEMLTGGENNSNGKRWHLSQTENASRAMADITFTTTQSLTPDYFSELGFSNVYFDEFVFKDNGDYAIIPKGSGVIGGLTYCKAKNIPNSPPTPEASEGGLTLIDPFTPPSGLKFSFIESTNYTVTASDGSSVYDITYQDAMTLSFSKGGFLGINNWLTDCIITELTEKSMRVALFASTISQESLQSGKTNVVFVLTFVPSEN